MAPDPPRQTIEEIVIEKLPVELWDTWEGADSEIRRIIWDTVSGGHVGSAMKEVAGEAGSKRDILRRCMMEAGYSVRPEMALSPMHSPARGVSRAERERLLKIIESISETLADEAWGVLHDDYIRLSQAVSDLALEKKLGPRRREKITLALNHFADAYHGHYSPPFRPDKAEMTEALAVVKKQVQGLS